MGQYEEQVEVVEAEVISDGSQSSEKDYWRKQLKEELRQNYVKIIIINFVKEHCLL